jgi:hypothetical protein
MKRRKIGAILFCLALSGLLVIGLFLVLSQTAQGVRASPGQLFVTPGGSGDCSQSNPCNLQTVLGNLNDGDEIYLAQGPYLGRDKEVDKKAETGWLLVLERWLLSGAIVKAGSRTGSLVVSRAGGEAADDWLVACEGRWRGWPGRNRACVVG